MINEALEAYIRTRFNVGDAERLKRVEEIWDLLQALMPELETKNYHPFLKEKIKGLS